MKKICSYLSVLLMMASLSVPVIASESYLINKVETTSVKSFEITLIDQEFKPDSRIDIYSIYIPNSGEYYEIPDFCGEYEDDAHISVEGTWNPTYARLNVMIKETEFDTSVYSFVDCNESTSYGLWTHSEWCCYLKADGTDISGTITIEVT